MENKDTKEQRECMRYPFGWCDIETGDPVCQTCSHYARNGVPTVGVSRLVKDGLTATLTAYDRPSGTAFLSLTGTDGDVPTVGPKDVEDVWKALFLPGKASILAQAEGNGERLVCLRLKAAKKAE